MLMNQFMLENGMDDDCVGEGDTGEEDTDEEETSEDVPLISPPSPSIFRLQQNIAPPPPRADFLPPVDDPELLRVVAVGSRTVVNIFVHRLHQAGIVHFSEWSRLLPTPNSGEFMRILTKRIPIDRHE